jgi:ankyrin repeat protein
VTDSSGSAARALPERPDLRHLRQQARDLHRAGEAANLSAALHIVAQRYGFRSWPRLKAHVESLYEVGQLKDALDSEAFDRARELMTRNPALHRAPLGYGRNGPLTWVAECRIPSGPPTPERLEMVRWMIANGSDVHQGGDGPLMRAALNDNRIPMMEVLVEHGADVNARWAGFYAILCGTVECLAPRAMRWLLERGADLSAVEHPVGWLLGTYSRDAARKHECLAVLAEHGFEMPDTPVMALHRGRLDLLDEHLRRDRALTTRRFPETEVYPPALSGGEPGMHVTPVNGVTLLHLALEFDDLSAARWLIAHGAEVDARATVDRDGFGGHTSLFHAVATLGRKDEAKARVLLEAGADPNVRATFRKQLVDTGDPESEKMREFHNVTPIGYAGQFQRPGWVSHPAVALIREFGGTE